MKALSAAAVAAAPVVLLIAQPWRVAGARRAALAWIFGIGLGFYLGCWLLQLWPHWPARDCADRLMLVIFPSVLAVELIAALPRVPGWLRMVMRLVVAAGAAPVLLYKSSYVVDLGGPNSWSLGQAWMVLAGLAAALVLLWSLILLLVRRAPGISIPMTLAFVCGGAGLTIMLSGYATGGQLGLPLAAVLGGAAIVSITATWMSAASSCVGPAIVGIFSLLILGHFFGELTVTNGVVLFVAPLLGWLPELPYVRRLRPGMKGLARMAFVAALMAAVVFQAFRVFNEESKGSPGSAEPSLQELTWKCGEASGPFLRNGLPGTGPIYELNFHEGLTIGWHGLPGRRSRCAPRFC